MKSKKKIKAISLFSGCGGMDLGFEKEGFDIVWAIDSDFNACETYRNHFRKKVVNRDIVEIDFSKVPDCDVILGGFPCQDFSVIWSRQGIHGRRGDLYRHFVRAVIAKKPKAFVAENVKGLLSANKGKAYSQIISDFKKVGYCIYPHVYNFAEYGVPQFRQRLIIVGLRNDVDFAFEIPKTTHGPQKTMPFVNAREALRDVKKVKTNNEKMKIAEKTKKMLELIPPGGNFSDVPKASPYYVKGLISHVYRKLDPKKPAYTIIAAGGGGTWSYHYNEQRPLTNRERARLQTFPDNFVFYGNISEVRKQIGNAVPPEGVRPIAKELKNILMGKVSFKSTTLEDFIVKKHQSQKKNLMKEILWFNVEKKWDKKRKGLDKSLLKLSALGLPDWRGIESYGPKDLDSIIKNKNLELFKDLKKIILEHIKFYEEYYGTNGQLSPRMDQCEYNIYSAKEFFEKQIYLKTK